MGWPFVILFLGALFFWGLGVMIASCGIALVVYGIISIKKPGKIKSPKSKSLSIIMIITGAIIIIIGAAVAVGIGIVYFGGQFVGLVRHFIK